jgi:hypothetical protein
MAAVVLTIRTLKPLGKTGALSIRVFVQFDNERIGGKLW